MFEGMDSMEIDFWKIKGHLPKEEGKKFCIISGKEIGYVGHHVISRKAGGSDDPRNLMPLLHEYHVEIHAIGRTEFAEKYPQAKDWLLKNGWYFCKLANKWRHGELQKSCA